MFVSISNIMLIFIICIYICLLWTALQYRNCNDDIEDKRAWII